MAGSIRNISFWLDGSRLARLVCDLGLIPVCDPGLRQYARVCEQPDVALWCNWLTRRPLKAKSPGSSPGNATNSSYAPASSWFLPRDAACSSAARKPLASEDWIRNYCRPRVSLQGNHFAGLVRSPCCGQACNQRYKPHFEGKSLPRVGPPCIFKGNHCPRDGQLPVWKLCQNRTGLKSGPVLPITNGEERRLIRAPTVLVNKLHSY